MGSATLEEKSLKALFKAVIGRFLQMTTLYIPMTPLMRVKIQRIRGVCIGENVFLGTDVYLDLVHPDMITIEDNVAISGRNTIITHSCPPYHFKENHPRVGSIFSKVSPVTIKKGAWITVGVVILPGVTIGENAIVTAGSVVTKNIPANCIAQGNPAEVVYELK
ncbi:acyltransferase [Methanococcoides methylutens]|uniref:acyltransferase n=1 Tax=Methanococcoides methylutens TaxID=2226 RepID=UPI0022B0ED0F|nr:acyltransferase [Methanococcoides methylutens]